MEKEQTAMDIVNNYLSDEEIFALLDSMMDDDDDINNQPEDNIGIIYQENAEEKSLDDMIDYAKEKKGTGRRTFAKNQLDFISDMEKKSDEERNNKKNKIKTSLTEPHEDLFCWYGTDENENNKPIKLEMEENTEIGTCPVCNREFEYYTVLRNSLKCPNCGQPFDFD